MSNDYCAQCMQHHESAACPNKPRTAPLAVVTQLADLLHEVLTLAEREISLRLPPEELAKRKEKIMKGLKHGSPSGPSAADAQGAADTEPAITADPSAGADS